MFKLYAKRGEYACDAAQWFMFKNALDCPYS